MLKALRVFMQPSNIDVLVQQAGKFSILIHVKYSIEVTFIRFKLAQQISTVILQQVVFNFLLPFA